MSQVSVLLSILCERMNTFAKELILCIVVFAISAWLFGVHLAGVWFLITLAPIIWNCLRRIYVYRNMYYIAEKDKLIEMKFLQHYPKSKLSDYLHYASYRAYELFLDKHEVDLKEEDKYTSWTTGMACMITMTVVIADRLLLLYAIVMIG